MKNSCFPRNWYYEDIILFIFFNFISNNNKKKKKSQLFVKRFIKIMVNFFIFLNRIIIYYYIGRGGAILSSLNKNNIHNLLRKQHNRFRTYFARPFIKYNNCEEYYYKTREYNVTIELNIRLRKNIKYNNIIVLCSRGIRIYIYKFV